MDLQAKLEEEVAVYNEADVYIASLVSEQQRRLGRINMLMEILSESESENTIVVKREDQDGPNADLDE